MAESGDNGRELNHQQACRLVCDHFDDRDKLKRFVYDRYGGVVGSVLEGQSVAALAFSLVTELLKRDELTTLDDNLQSWRDHEREIPTLALPMAILALLGSGLTRVAWGEGWSRALSVCGLVGLWVSWTVYGNPPFVQNLGIWLCDSASRLARYSRPEILQAAAAFIQRTWGTHSILTAVGRVGMLSVLSVVFGLWIAAGTVGEDALSALLNHRIDSGFDKTTLVWIPLFANMLADLLSVSSTLLIAQRLAARRGVTPYLVGFLFDGLILLMNAVVPQLTTVAWAGLRNGAWARGNAELWFNWLTQIASGGAYVGGTSFPKATRFAVQGLPGDNYVFLDYHRLFVASSIALLLTGLLPSVILWGAVLLNAPLRVWNRMVVDVASRAFLTLGRERHRLQVLYAVVLAILVAVAAIQTELCEVLGAR